MDYFHPPDSKPIVDLDICIRNFMVDFKLNQYSP